MALSSTSIGPSCISCIRLLFQIGIRILLVGVEVGAGNGRGKGRGWGRSRARG